MSTSMSHPPSNPRTNRKTRTGSAANQRPAGGAAARTACVEGERLASRAVACVCPDGCRVCRRRRETAFRRFGRAARTTRRELASGGRCRTSAGCGSCAGEKADRHGLPRTAAGTAAVRSVVGPRSVLADKGAPPVRGRAGLAGTGGPAPGLRQIYSVAAVAAVGRGCRASRAACWLAGLIARWFPAIAAGQRRFRNVR
jgi:hypothetical protein